ncbi:MAG: flavodoxin family protein [Thermoguttaceae bacterium]|jgi:multimeric flavodoxin WrbA
MKRVLGIVGSPRRNGNTHVLVTKILDGAAEAGAATETVFLEGLTIRSCDGCHVCWKTGRCAKNDDMTALYPKIAESDVLVLGTPVYWYGPTALLKGFLDRFVYFNCPETRPQITGKSAVLAVPFEEDNLDTAAILVEMFRRSLEYMDINLAAKLLVPGVARKGEVLDKPAVIDEALRIGRQLG